MPEGGEQQGSSALRLKTPLKHPEARFEDENVVRANILHAV